MSAPTWDDLLTLARRWGDASGRADVASSNAGLLIRGAREAGWDIIIPGTGYDAMQGPGEASEAVVVAGPDGSLEPVVRVRPRHATEPLSTPVVAFLFDMPHAFLEMAGDDSLSQITFRCETYFSTFALEISSPDRRWALGAPDLREATHGWVAWLESEAVISLIAPPYVLDTERISIDVDTKGQPFWLGLARAAVRIQAGLVSSVNGDRCPEGLQSGGHQPGDSGIRLAHPKRTS